MIVRENQITPYHFHWNKMEDIINRGGGNLVIRLYNRLPDEQMDTVGDVTAHLDGRTATLPAGGTVTLTPGESITLVQGQYHSFWGQAGTGAVMVGEVSRVNDDHADNRFAVLMIIISNPANSFNAPCIAGENVITPPSAPTRKPMTV